MKFKVGDLAITNKGNHVIILEIGKNKRGKVDWYNVAFISGNIRTGYPADWVRKVRCK